MPSSCCVFGCYNRKLSVNKPISFFSFPKDPTFRSVWVQRCYREDKFNPNTCRICSTHFSPIQYANYLKMRLLNANNNPNKYKFSPKLKPDAVPDLNLPSRKNRQLGLPELNQGTSGSGK